VGSCRLVAGDCSRCRNPGANGQSDGKSHIGFWDHVDNRADSHSGPASRLDSVAVPRLDSVADSPWPNGRPAAYFRVNHAFRGVHLPAAGTYTISYDYWPQFLTLALWLGLAGALGLVAITYWLWRRPPGFLPVPPAA